MGNASCPGVHAGLVLLGLALGLTLSGPALAESHTVTVVNRSGEAVRRIHVSPAGAASPGENRLRSQLPPGAEARITYSTGCSADVRVGFDGGRTEEFARVDVCSDPRLTTGGGTASNATIGPGAPASVPAPAASRTAARGQAAAPAPPPIAPVVVPPWTGRSITRRFGGMD